MNSKDFARMIGVSQPTVSRALNDSPLVPEEKRKWIKEKAREYGFVLNNSARSLKTSRTNTIGILFPKHFVGMTENIMMAHLYDQIQRELHKRGFDIMVVYSDTGEDDLSALERMIRTKKVDGFLILRLELSDEERKLIGQEKTPCVCMMNASTKVRDDISYYFSDSEYGGYLAGDFYGDYPDYKKVYISYCQEKDDNTRRKRGFLRGLQEHGVQEADITILESELGIREASRLIHEHKEFFLNNKTAILAYCDIIGIGVVQGLKEIGVSIPDQAQVIGMDDIPWAFWLDPQLSTLHVDAEHMVPETCDLLIRMINGQGKAEAGDPEPVHQWLKPTLILRDTTI